MKVRYTDPAKEDLAAIIDFLEPLSPGGAKKVVGAIRKTASGTGRFPLRGRLQEDGSRKLVSLPYSYIVYYEINETENTVDILTISIRPKNAKPTTHSFNLILTIYYNISSRLDINNIKYYTKLTLLFPKQAATQPYRRTRATGRRDRTAITPLPSCGVAPDP